MLKERSQHSHNLIDIVCCRCGKPFLSYVFPFLTAREEKLVNGCDCV